jgi:hypothetical protein
VPLCPTLPAYWVTPTAGRLDGDPWSRHRGVMSLDREQIEGINYALNEAGVAGLRMSDDQSRVDLLVHVLALPAVGPIDPDARRVVALLYPSLIEVVLQKGLGEKDEPAIPFSDIDDVNAFLSSMTWSHEMYGWPFLDGSAEARSKWPSPISLDMAVPGGRDEHSLYWFAECGRRWGDDNYESFFIQGMITFGGIEVRRANGDIELFDEFIADADRYWAALFAHDERLSVEAQRAAGEGTPKW